MRRHFKAVLKILSLGSQPWLDIDLMTTATHLVHTYFNLPDRFFE
jgi:hypothetical protein